MHTLSLTTAELEIVLSALAVTAPSGGGSSVFTLYRKIAGETGKTSPESLEAHFCDTVVAGAVEAGVVAYIERPATAMSDEEIRQTI